MDGEDRIAEIKRKLEENAYFVNPLSDANVKEDIAFLLNLLRQQNEVMEKLKRKNDVLSHQNLELTQEIENVKGDFGDQSR